jgi:hypothetical protein
MTTLNIPYASAESAESTAEAPQIIDEQAFQKELDSAVRSARQPIRPPKFTDMLKDLSTVIRSK